MPTPNQLMLLERALKRYDRRLCKPRDVDIRMWMTQLVKMDEKGFIRWEGPRPFISERGVAAVEEKPYLPDRVSGKNDGLPKLALKHQRAYRKRVEHADQRNDPA